MGFNVATTNPAEWRIKSLMQLYGITQSELAQAAGLDRGTVGYHINNLWRTSPESKVRIGAAIRKILDDEKLFSM